MFKFLAPLAATFALVLGAAPASAQGVCGPDNLDGGPCCLPTGVTLPSFPKIAGTDAKWIAFDNCGVALAKPYCVDLGKPKPLSAGAIYCGQYDVRLQLRDCLTGVLHWSGGLRMSYSRNWMESTTPGAIGTTVWRFLLNGDILPTAAVPMNPLERPTSLNVYTRLYVSGHIDYALDCATGQWSVAWSLNHECDQVHHRPGTARPAPATGFDPGRSWSIVGPGASFVPMPGAIPVSDGPVQQGLLPLEQLGRRLQPVHLPRDRAAEQRDRERALLPVRHLHDRRRTVRRHLRRRRRPVRQLDLPDARLALHPEVRSALDQPGRVPPVSRPCCSTTATSSSPTAAPAPSRSSGTKVSRPSVASRRSTSPVSPSAASSRTGAPATTRPPTPPAASAPRT
jgi:hypothetical protein